MAQDRLTPFRRLLRLLSVDRKDLFYIYFYALLSSLISLSLPLGIQAIVGLMGAGQATASWGVLIAVVLGGIAFAGVLSILQFVLIEYIQQKIFVRSAFEFTFRITRLNMEHARRFYLPELMNRFFDTLSVQKGLSKLLLDFSFSAVQILVSLALLAFYHPSFLIFGLVLVSLLLAIMLGMGPAGLRTSLDESKQKYEVAYWLEEVARNMSSFKLAGQTGLPAQRTDKLVNAYLGARKKHFRLLVIQSVFVLIFRVLAAGGLLVMGSLLIFSGQMNLGQFVAAEIVVIFILNASEKMVMNLENIYDILTAIEKMGAVTDLPLENEEGIPFAAADTGKGMSIRAENLGYTFEETGTRALDGLNFEVASNGSLGLTGSGGAGKTVLLQILGGLYSEFDGRLLLNGHPLRSLNTTGLRRHTGDTFSQETFFPGTLLENITLGREWIELSEVQETCEKLGLNEFLQSLPLGLETPVQAGGAGLSRNFALRLILARALVGKPRLVLIDDNTFAMPFDEKAEMLDFLFGGELNTTLVVSTNDPAVLERCDEVVYLRKGKRTDPPAEAFSPHL